MCRVHPEEGPESTRYPRTSAGLGTLHLGCEGRMEIKRRSCGLGAEEIRVLSSIGVLWAGTLGSLE